MTNTAGEGTGPEEDTGRFVQEKLSAEQRQIEESVKKVLYLLGQYLEDGKINREDYERIKAHQLKRLEGL